MKDEDDGEKISNRQEKKYNLFFGKNKNHLELVIDNPEELESHIDDILYLNDLLNKIGKISNYRDEFGSLFSVSKRVIEFYFDMTKWSQWEKAALILFTRFPFPTNRDYVSNHDIPKGNLNKYLTRYEEYFRKFNGNQISLTQKGFYYILDKLNKEMITESKSDEDTENSEESE